MSFLINLSTVPNSTAERPHYIAQIKNAAASPTKEAPQSLPTSFVINLLTVPNSITEPPHHMAQAPVFAQPCHPLKIACVSHINGTHVLYPIA